MGQVDSFGRKGCLPLRIFILSALWSSFLFIWPSSADPWWRVKEWVLFLVGLIWISVRGFLLRGCPQKRSIPLLGVLFLGYLTVQWFYLNVYPIIKANGLLIESPWPWIAFVQLLTALFWILDLVTLGEDRDFLSARRSLVGIGFLLSLLMILQYFGKDPVLFYISRRFVHLKWLSENHMIGLCGNPFQAGACLAACMPAMVFSGSAISFLVPASVLVASKGASALTAGVLGSLLTLWVQKRRRLFFAVSSVSFLSGLFMISRGFFGLSGRMQIWRLSMPALFKHFWTGYGLGTYKLLNLALPHNAGTIKWAHNEWIHFSIEFGVIGILLMAALSGVLFLKGFRSQEPVWTGTLASLCVLSIASIPWHLAPTLAVTAVAMAGIIAHKEVSS